jgi:four helix bundle protein
MRDDKDNLIVNITFSFAVDIMQFSERLIEVKKFAIADQVLRAGVFVGANVREAQNSESKADFIHKLKVAAKEADEVEYLLLLCKAVPSYPFQEELLEKVKSIIKILSKIISSSKRPQ